MPTASKIPWQGHLLAIQPRIRLNRAFDARWYTYLGYILFLDGRLGDEPGEFAIAIGKAAHAKHEFRVGDEVTGASHDVADHRLEVAGYRRLATRTYGTRCKTCIWGAKMSTVIIIDHWNQTRKRYRYETHCYGPLSCMLYKAGPPRRVPGRKKWMEHIEEDWIDREATGHREPDE